MGSFFNAILIIICGWAFAGILFLFIYRNLFFTRRKKILDILKNGLFCYGRVLELIHEGFKTYIKVKLLDVENSNSSIVTISPFYANYKRPKIGDCAFVYYMHSDLTKAVLYSFLSGDKDYELLLKQAENIFYLQEKGCSYCGIIEEISYTDNEMIYTENDDDKFQYINFKISVPENDISLTFGQYICKVKIPKLDDKVIVMCDPGDHSRCLLKIDIEDSVFCVNKYNLGFY